MDKCVLVPFSIQKSAGVCVFHIQEVKRNEAIRPKKHPSPFLILSE